MKINIVYDVRDVRECLNAQHNNKPANQLRSNAVDDLPALDIDGLSRFI